MSAGLWWIAAGLVLGAAEMAVPGVFMLPIGLAAIGAGALTEWLGLGGPAQVIAFVALTLVLIGAAWTRMRRVTRGDRVNAPSAGLIGQTCRAVTFEAGEGRVTLGDGTWPARTTDRSAPATGALLQVVGLDGTTLVVQAPPIVAGL